MTEPDELDWVVGCSFEIPEKDKNMLVLFSSSPPENLIEHRMLNADIFSLSK